MDHLTKIEMVEDALDIYRDSLIAKIESMPEFKALCERELAKAIDAFPLEVKNYIYNAKGFKQYEPSKWKNFLSKI